MRDSFSNLENQNQMRNSKLILGILLAGILYRLFLTWNGNFLFNMDNARDMVDVREMVVLHKLRLIGPTSAIEGLFNGPAWYYLLAIPFVLSGGDPYASIIMEIILWAIGGFFLLKLVSKWGTWITITIGLLWVASNYIVLTNLYAFNPNPVTLLTPLFIFLLFKYLETGRFLYSISAWFLGGLFFNFEMNFGIFIPVIILVSTFFIKKNLLKKKAFWLGSIFFVVILMPQIIFDLRHQFIMSKSVLNFLDQGSSGMGFNPAARLQTISSSFFNTFVPTLMNHQTLAWIILGLFILLILKIWKSAVKKNSLVILSLVYIFVPFLGYLILPVAVNPWHLGGEMSASLILIGFLLKEIRDFNLMGKLIAPIIGILICFFALVNIFNFFLNDVGKINMDPSLYKNEIAAIDYVYKKAEGQNFRVYTYLPSVYDYPYQYLFWWYGKKTYGYIPGEYVYSPNKPPYIPSQDKFQGSKENFSGLVFLIKEPNRNYTRFGWEGDFIKYNWETIGKEMVGPLEVEIRKEVNWQ
ncbi:MAG: Uncharacterized protein G01um10147_95 [Microgenomates group bacterium Gr01-1014_7]|nr:MAG: Uncharacterized protein G01um10147_95 [Microgenomates group bacterium Gr01-1014_7]